MHENNGHRPSIDRHHLDEDGRLYILDPEQGSLFDELPDIGHLNGNGNGNGIHKPIAQIAMRSEVLRPEEQNQ